MEIDSIGRQSTHGKANPYSKTPLSCGYIQNMGKALKVNPDRKHEVESRRLVVLNTDNIPGTPAAKLPLNLMPCIPLVLVSTAKRRTCSLHSARLPYTIACLGEGKL